jgi:hypothetical protein
LCCPKKLFLVFGCRSGENILSARCW